MSGSQQQPPPPAEEPERPDPIVGLAGTFDLGADPEALRTAASAIRGLALRAAAAGLTVTTAAGGVESDEAWTGDTADNYQQHRRRLTGDLESLGYEAGAGADALDEIANLLTVYQTALDGERATLAGVPTTTSPGLDPDDPSRAFVSYQPATEEEAATVRDTLRRAADLRLELADDLALKESALRRAVDGYAAPASIGGAPGLRLLGETWRPRTVRLLNLNIGEGDPTDADDMDDIAGIINGQGANVVTIQEVYREDIDNLQEHLDGEWEVYFANADNKNRGASPENWSEDFGNAVLVRQGDGLSSQSVEEDNRIKLDAEGSWYPRPGDDTSGQVDNVDPDDMVTATVSEDEIPQDEVHRADGEGRAAAVAQITFEP